MVPRWAKFKRSLPIAHSALFSEVMHGMDLDDVFTAGDIHEILDGLSEMEKQVKVAEILTVEFSRILHISEEKIDHNRPIQEIGIDSLMGMELATAINSRFGIDIPLMVLANNISLDGLARRILDSLTTDAAGTVPASSSAEIVSSLASAHAEELPEEVLENITRAVDDHADSRRRLN